MCDAGDGALLREAALETGDGAFLGEALSWERVLVRVGPVRSTSRERLATGVSRNSALPVCSSRRWMWDLIMVDWEGALS